MSNSPDLHEKTPVTGSQAASFYSGRNRGTDEWAIRPRRSGLVNLFKDLWDYRGIFGFIAARALMASNRRLLGAAWLVIRPAITAIVAVQVVGKVLGISTGAVPLVLFIMVGLALWWLVAAGLRYGTRAVTKGRDLIRRVNFPRVMLLLGAFAPTLVEFAVVFAAALATFGYFTYTGAYVPAPDWHVFAILPVLLLVMALVLALSCVTSVLNNIATDTALTVNYGVSFLLVATPVAYPLDALPKDWQWAFLLNPLTPAFEVWRWALLGTPLPPWWSIAAGVLLTTILLAGSLIFFLRWEQTILDRS